MTLEPLPSLANVLTGAVGAQIPTAHLRQGKITAVDFAASTVTFTVGGSTATYTSGWLDSHYWPEVNDDVTIVQSGSDFVVVGSTVHRPLVSSSLIALTNDTHTNPSASPGYEHWGGGSWLVTANPIRPVRVDAVLMGYVQAQGGGAARRLSGTRTSISISGGSSYSDGTPVLARVIQDSVDYMPVVALHSVSGTPTGTIRVRGLIAQFAGAAGDIEWLGGQILVTITPT